MIVKLDNLGEKEILDRGVRDWPSWEKEAFQVDWYYDAIQDCLMLEGEVLVKNDKGQLEFKKQGPELIESGNEKLIIKKFFFQKILVK
ncbi:MAG: hypothetical protein K9N09_06620 [Candidatus Cloacimonetes bacterium]|nr:hypothetical protein [Candidatus Cloacimonadota bacterium]MCF7813772.1 hypothetical protein [Candidatus Cloacimonadota bacterium]MCF7868356.1 hypothetical protein [Candidatus Cloacimonadota bacterium]MCF7883830.1 hypothetical protein [Candidatus Cloacimonadota bacterium]